METVDCRETRAGNYWIVDFLRNASVAKVIVDGANGQQLLSNEMKEARLKAPMLPTVKDIIVANAAFEQGLYQSNIAHMGQSSVEQVVGNCEKRAIGSNGGFSYESQQDNIEIAILDSIILAYWACVQVRKEKSKK